MESVRRFFKKISSSMSFKTKQILKNVVFDILMIGIGLVIFAYFHHVAPRKAEKPVELPKVTQSVENNNTSSPIESSDPTLTPDNEQNDKYADKFLSEGSEGKYTKDPENGRYSYISSNLNVDVKRVQENGVTYFVADIYVKSIDNIKTYLVDGAIGQNNKARVSEMAQAVNAVVAISGDYCGARSDGIVVRNGVMYRSKISYDREILAMYADGTMEIFDPHDFDLEAESKKGLLQTWDFGPGLLGENGEALTEIKSKIGRENPRSAIGYFDKNHYCFVTVDGRQDGYSKGMKLTELSELFASLGCKKAYNLDGGETAMMAFDGEIISKPADGGRRSSDIIYVGEVGK